MEPGPDLATVWRVAAADLRSSTEQREHAVATYQQHLVDAEVASTRHRLLRRARRAGARYGFLDPDFLSVADRPTVSRAVVDAALRLGRASSVDLQLCDEGGTTLRMEASVGFSAEFLDHFEALTAGDATACVTAWSTRQPVLVRNVTRSAIFTDTSTIEVLLTAGSRAILSCPLLVDGTAVGVLSFHAGRVDDLPRDASALARRAAIAVMVTNRGLRDPARRARGPAAGPLATPGLASFRQFG